MGNDFDQNAVSKKNNLKKTIYESIKNQSEKVSE
jgi:hypothetical protein